MLYTFATVSDSKFEINGYEMFKTFIPFFVNNTTVRVINIYDSKLQLVTSSNVSDFEVNGITYANATDLINALAPVIFAFQTGGTLDSAQIEANRIAIINLQTEINNLNFDNYYNKTEVDNIISGLGVQGNVPVQAVIDGSNLTFTDANDQDLFTVDVKSLRSQGVSITFDEETGKLTLINVFGDKLSEVTIKAKIPYYDVLEYQTGLENDLNDLVQNSKFTLAKTLDESFYVVSDLDNSESFSDSRINIVEIDTYFDLGSPDIETATFVAWELAIVTDNFIEGNDYAFNFWLKNSFATGGFQGTAQDLKDYIDAVIETGGVQTVTGSAVDNTDPLNPVINVSGGGTSEPPVDETYANVTSLIAEQNNQLTDYLYKVTDASDDPTVNSGKAIYLYLGTTVGTIADYLKLWEEEEPASPYGTRVDMGSSFEIDWANPNEVFLKTIDSSTPFTDVNLPTGINVKNIRMYLTGVGKFIPPIYWILRSSSYDVNKINRIEADCISGNSGSELVYYTVDNVEDSINPYVSLKFTIDTNLGTGASFTVPAYTAIHTYLYDIDFGDGTILTAQTGIVTHNYSSDGVYNIKITGVYPAFYFNRDGDCLKLTSIDQWGDVGYSTNQNYAFTGCENLTSIAQDMEWANNITTAHSMFSDCSLTELPSILTFENLEYGYKLLLNNNLTDLPNGITFGKLIGTTAGQDILRGQVINTIRFSKLLVDMNNYNQNTGIRFYAQSSKYNSSAVSAVNSLEAKSWTLLNAGLE